MHEFFLQLSGIVGILFCCKAHQSVIVHVDSQRVETCDENVDSQIVLQAIEKVRMCEVLGCQVPLPFVNFLLAVDDLDASTTAGSDWL